MPRYEPVDPGASFPDLERAVLEFWREEDVFGQSVRRREGAPEWVFYEGPPTANGKPGIHHLESRTFKDVYPRYRTMTGHRVERRAGWDCHGLPVEIEVEKAIGTAGKRDIEAFGIAEFNRLCRESVTRYVEEWERLTERIGFWIDLSDAYWTMSPEYIESVWWSLRTLFDSGLLYEEDRVVAYCPRCGTALSDHEVSMGYTEVEDPSVYVRFPITESPDPELVGASLVVWTTTPWTLISNTGAAVAPSEPYAVAERDGVRLILAVRLVEPVLGEDATVVRTVPGSTLVGSRYRPPFPGLDAHRVAGADFVSMGEGTGVVHLAPAFGPEDLAIGKEQGWPVWKPVDDSGRFTDLTPVEAVRGLFVKDADPVIVKDLENRGLLLRSETIRHTYPLCWRCDTPLLHLARASWYIRTTARKDRLLEVNQSVNWYPDHIKRGRYGDWLENNVDWALSRERYWGTPLPLWRCPSGHVTAVGSLAELSELAGSDLQGLDPHRPAIDEVEIGCRECGQPARRVPEVIDAWYDSGAMPYAQWSFHPDLGRGVGETERGMPADFISEAIDQTRGWFYSLMAEAVLLFDDTAYRNVVCLGHIVDRDGRKMSKRLGNILDPWEVLDSQGADALRWFLLTSGSPWSSRRVYPEAVDDVVRRFMLTVRNVHAFFVTYANADDFDPSEHHVPLGERPLLDRWIMSRLSGTVGEARERLDGYDATGAGRRIAAFVDDLSNWYVRRSRRRFWDPAGNERTGRAKVAAHLTLHTCLTTLAGLLAPFTPFLSEALWRSLQAGRDGAPPSVHLTDYPTPDAEALDETLDRAMHTARTIVSLGRTVRTEAGVKVRQPLARAVVHFAGRTEDLAPLLPLVAEELNVDEVAFAETAEQLTGWRVKPSYRALGPRLGAEVKELAGRLADDDGTIAATLARGEEVTVDLPGGPVRLGPGEVDLHRETASGWGVAAEGGLTVALDLEVTPELLREGLARDLVRGIQEARKGAGLEVTDRIELAVDSRGAAAEALESHRDTIAHEVLAVEVVDRIPDDWDGAFGEEIELGGEKVKLAFRRTR